jgi:hypothetical protein
MFAGLVGRGVLSGGRWSDVVAVREAEAMKVFLLGLAVGYVFGTKAGRERYDQIMRAYHTVVEHPAVQSAAGVARAKIGQKLGRSH